MEYRQLLNSGLRVPAFTFGTATFGGVGDFFKAWGSTDVDGAKRLIDICLDGGISFFDTANGYSAGRSEEILGEALAGKRSRALISTKSTIPQGEGPYDYGSSRSAIIANLEASLRRLKTDYIDLYYMHAYDAHTPMEEILRALDDMITQGKIRYVGCSNFSGWHLMKSLSISERHGWSKYVAHQAYYSLAAREFEWELMPLAQDQNVSTIVWSPLAAGALTGKYRRGQAAPKDARLSQTSFGVAEAGEPLYKIVDVIDEVVKETGKTAAQVVLNWTLSRPTVASLVIGARNEAQLKENLGAIGWSLTREQTQKLDRASENRPVYPYWHQRDFPLLQKSIL
ncbi:MAG: aldo/keto reductase [Proteobacteria bacterium]|nr:MAG: aldo/keto reductase [Pseudomonadota bacterium]